MANSIKKIINNNMWSKFGSFLQIYNTIQKAVPSSEK